MSFYIQFTQPVPNIPTPFPSLLKVSPFLRKPLFSDNSLVYYVPHSLATGTATTVRNSRAVARRT
jgi:hypothetical protein